MSEKYLVIDDMNHEINISFKFTKGQLISKWNFGVFKSPKKPTKFLTDFCPLKLGQKSVYNLVGSLGDLKFQKILSEINWPLVIAISKSRTLLSSETKIEIHWNRRMGSGNFNKFNTAPLLLVCDIKWTHWLLNLNPADAKKMTP